MNFADRVRNNPVVAEVEAAIEGVREDVHAQPEAPAPAEESTTVSVGTFASGEEEAPLTVTYSGEVGSFADNADLPDTKTDPAPAGGADKSDTVAVGSFVDGPREAEQTATHSQHVGSFADHDEQAAS